MHIMLKLLPMVHCHRPISNSIEEIRTYIIMKYIK